MEEYIDRYPSEGMIASDTLSSGHHVSTIWLGMDLRMDPDAGPQIYQTMVFGPGLDDRWDGYSRGYATLTAAKAGHAEVVNLVEMDLDMDRKRQRHRCHRKGHR